MNAYQQASSYKFAGNWEDGAASGGGGGGGGSVPVPTGESGGDCEDVPVAGGCEDVPVAVGRPGGVCGDVSVPVWVPNGGWGDVVSVLAGESDSGVSGSSCCGVTSVYGSVDGWAGVW